MAKRLDAIIKEGRRARHLTLPGLAGQVNNTDGKSISPQARFDIEAHRRLPAPYILRELARVFDLGYDLLLAAAGRAVTAVEEYLEAYPQQSAAIIKCFRGAHEFGNEDWLRIQQRVERGGPVKPT